MIVTISGMSCSGKSTFALFLSKKTKAKVISVDSLISKLYEREDFCKELLSAFGEKVCENQKVNKKLVGNLVFTSKKNQNILTKISTPFIEKEIAKEIESEKNVVIDYKFSPMLEIFKSADINILLVAKNEKRREQMIFERDELPKEYLLARDKNSPSFSDFRFDFVFVHDFDELEEFSNFVASKMK